MAYRITCIIYLHVVHEQRVVSSGRHDSNFDSVLRVPVQELIINKHLKVHLDIQLLIK
ncbi:hypothetical protein HanRHA438_Chr14g0660671 [Helianthus annuus]|nr:hypothetical protein HanRHA438_Chr14g0660671 [Helianthus annuus]